MKEERYCQACHRLLTSYTNPPYLFDLLKEMREREYCTPDDSCPANCRDLFKEDSE